MQWNTVFQLLPSRKRYPEYYEHIAEPMDLKTVAEKIQKGQYKEITELEKDLQLIFSNARSFNEPGSQGLFESRNSSHKGYTDS